MTKRVMFPTEERLCSSFGGRVASFTEVGENRWRMRGTIDSDFPVYVFLELVDWREISGEPYVQRWHVLVSAASPGFAGEDEMNAALSCLGIEENAEELSQAEIADALDEYGCSMVIWQGCGNNREELLKAAKEEATLAISMFGFYADRPQNLAGRNGFELLRGVLGS